MDDPDFVHVWTLREGAVTSFRVYYDTVYVASVLRDDATQDAGAGGRG